MVVFDPATWAPRDCDRQLEWSGSPQDITDACTELEASDRKAERSRPLWLVLATILGGGTFIVGMGLRSWWITLTGLGIAGVLGRQLLRADRKNIEARKVSLLRTLLDAFAGKLRNGMPLRVTLDLRGFWHYEPNEPWITLSLPMADRVDVHIRLITVGEYDEDDEELVSSRCSEALIVRLDAPEGRTIVEGDAPKRRPQLGPLMLCRSSFESNSATFEFSTDPLSYEIRDSRGLLTKHTIPRHGDVVDAITLCRQSLIRVEADDDLASTAEQT